MRLPKTEFARLVDRAIRDIPPAIARHLQNISIEVEWQPDAATCRDLELDDPADLMGLYFGTPLTERSVEDHAALPDRIVVYQRNIESVTSSRGEIIKEIRTTVLHEIGHHFGLDEGDLERLGYE